MMPGKYGDYEDVVLACKNRVNLLVKIIDDNVDGIGGNDDQEFLYGVISVLRDINGDLDILVDKTLLDSQ